MSRSWDSSVSLVTKLWVAATQEQQCNSKKEHENILFRKQADWLWGGHSASHLMDKSGSLPRPKQPEHKADHFFFSRARG